MASTAEKLDPELWEQAKADARDAFGGHSARAMQLAVKLYKQRGGRYRGPKKKDNRLTQWSRQDWKTKSGRPSRETGERYLPAAAIESLTPAEYGATTRAKRRGGGVGSVVAQPQSIREKTRKFRKVNPDMATAKQIAARKKFAERARSGELARMRKKSTRKSNPMEGGHGNRYEIRRRGIGMAKYPIASYSDLGLAKDYLDEIDRPVGTHYGYDTKTKEVFNSFAFETRNMKRNPTATRAASRKANPRKRDALTDYFKKMNIEDFKDRLLENEDQNLHGENVVMLARRYGGEKTISDAEIILKKQELAGYLTPELAEARRKLEIRLFPKYENELSEYIKATVKRNPTATRPGRSRTKLVSNGGRKSNPATKDVFFVNVIDDGGFQFGMDDRTPVLFKFSNREMKKGVYRSFALPFNVTSNAEFQNFVKSLPGNQIMISLKDLQKQLSAYT